MIGRAVTEGMDGAHRHPIGKSGCEVGLPQRVVSPPLPVVRWNGGIDRYQTSRQHSVGDVPGGEDGGGFGDLGVGAGE